MVHNRKSAMPSFRIFRLKDHVRQTFRWTPHLSGLSQVKPRDYEEAATIDGGTPYTVWAALRGTADELRIGDVMEQMNDGSAPILCIVKYVGFEQAEWILPEPKPVLARLEDLEVVSVGPTAPQ